MAERYRAPKIEAFVRREIEIPMSAAIAAASQGTIVTGLITFPFKVVKVKMYFRNDAANLVRCYWLVSESSTGSTTGIPPGDNLFKESVPLPYFVGEDEIREVLCYYEDEDGNKHIKLHVDNAHTIAQEVQATVTIRRL